MKKKETKKLRLNSETITRLDLGALENKHLIPGGNPCTLDCIFPIPSQCRDC